MLWSIVEIACHARQAGDKEAAGKAKDAITLLRAQKKAEKEIQEMAEGLAKRDSSGVIEIEDEIINIQGITLQKR